MFVNGLGYVYVCESYVVLDQCDESPSLFVLSVCAYGGLVGYVLCSGVFCCVVCAWCCYDLCGCVNGASPVRFVLSLFYLCAIQMNPVCVVCMVTSD